MQFKKYNFIILIFASLFMSLITSLPVLASTVSDRSELAYKDFVIIIPSYNNQRWCRDNILTALNQDYPIAHFKIIFVNDCSVDLTSQLVSEAVRLHSKREIVTIINNPERHGALRNFYDVITNLCTPQQIIVTLDGDDQLKDATVLSYLNQVYADPNVWITYGSYDFFPPRPTFIAGASAYSAEVAAAGDFRGHGFSATHLRTFYAGLFCKIKLTDLQDNTGQFWQACWDEALMFPMLEMACERSQFISKVLYRYNTANPIADNRVNLGLMSKFAGEYRAGKYQRLVTKDW